VVILSAKNLNLADSEAQGKLPQQHLLRAAKHGTGRKAHKQQQAAAAAAGNPAAQRKLSTYCVMRFGRQVLRTPIAHHGSAAEAVWNWQFSLALPTDLASTGVHAAAQHASSPPASQASQEQQDVVRLSVYDAQTLGDPALLGSCKVWVWIGGCS
jgi:hypothetical protein